MKRLINKDYYKNYIFILLIEILILFISYRRARLVSSGYFYSVYSFNDILLIIPSVILFFSNICTEYFQENVFYRYEKKIKLFYVLFEKTVINSLIFTGVYFLPTVIMAYIFRMSDFYFSFQVSISFFMCFMIIQLVFLIVYSINLKSTISFIISYLIFMLFSGTGIALKNDFISTTTFFVITSKLEYRGLVFIILTLTCLIVSILSFIVIRKIEVK